MHISNPNFSGFYGDLGGDLLVLGFGGLGAVSNPNVLWGHAFFKAINVSHISLTPLRPHWWHRDALGDEARTIQDIARNYDRVVCYGHSMGGHGCFVHADDLGATGICASAPQYTINPDKLEVYHRDLHHYYDPAVHSDMESLSAKCPATVIIDPRDSIDCWHLSKIRQKVPQVCTFALPFTGHRPLEFLSEAKALRSVVEILLKQPDQISKARGIARAGRRKSQIYLDERAKKLAARNAKGQTKLPSKDCHSLPCV